MTATITTISMLYKDHFPLPGHRLKQYVADGRREAAWERETCPRFMPAQHDDNTGLECRNSMQKVPWTFLEHDCCYFCNDLCERYQEEPEVKAWLAEKAKRPPICEDRAKLSDEVEPEHPPLAMHPFFGLVPR